MNVGTDLIVVTVVALAATLLAARRMSEKWADGIAAGSGVLAAYVWRPASDIPNDASFQSLAVLAAIILVFVGISRGARLR